MKFGLVIISHCGNARQLGHTLALETMENAGKENASNYSYMIASSLYEEEYLKKIKGVVGKVPLFGERIADYNDLGNTHFLYMLAWQNVVQWWLSFIPKGKLLQNIPVSMKIQEFMVLLAKWMVPKNENEWKQIVFFFKDMQIG